MEILAEHDGLVTNAEALEHIRERQRQRQREQQEQLQRDAAGEGLQAQPAATLDVGDRDWIEQRVTEFLTNRGDYGSGTPSLATVQRILTELNSDPTFAQLEDAEKLQLANLGRPEEVEVHLVVEECEERLTEEDTGRLVDILRHACDGGEAAPAALEAAT
eukprot:g1188.t1